MRKRGRVDNEQSAIVAALRGIGASVAVTSALGNGFPDLVVCFHHKLMLLEIKTDREGLNAMEQGFHAKWGGKIHIVRTAEQAQELVIREALG